MIIYVMNVIFTKKGRTVTPVRLEPAAPRSRVKHSLTEPLYEGGSICNENPFITPSTNALGLYAICQTKDQSVVIIMVHETLCYLSKFNKLQTFLKAH